MNTVSLRYALRAALRVPAPRVALPAISLTLAAALLPQTAGAGAILQPADDAGLLVIEAEDFDRNEARGAHSWVAGESGDASGARIMRSTPNNGTRLDSGLASRSPRLDYEIEFRQAGTHYLWLRGLGASGDDDSVHVGLNGLRQDGGNSIANFSPSNGWSNLRMGQHVAVLNIPAPGRHTLNVWMREDGFELDRILLTADASYLPEGDGPAASPRAPSTVTAVFMQGDDGLLTVDAENYHRNTPRGAHAWQDRADSAAVGGAALIATPNDGARLDSNLAELSPRLDYEVEFQQAGTHYLWLRGLGTSGASDSVHVGLNGQRQEGGDRLANFGPSFGWSNMAMGQRIATIEVPAPGRHTINVWMREAGFQLDRLLLSPAADYVPEGEGPAQSTQSDVGDGEETRLSAIRQQADGLVVIDAADSDDRESRNGMEWRDLSISGQTGAGALQAWPNDNVGIDTDFVTQSPRVDYRVAFNAPGTYQVWVRGLGATGKDDSLHVGLNGAAVDSADRIEGFGANFGWSQDTRDGAPASLTIPSAGVYTVNVFMREDGFVLDKLLLVPEANGYVPSAQGPAPSPREMVDADDSGQPNDGNDDSHTDSHPRANPDQALTEEGQSVLIAVLDNDKDLNDTPLTVRLSQQPSHGSAVVDSSNRILYTPDTGFSGTDDFMYSVTDADGDRADANVRVTVECSRCADGVQVRLNWAPSGGPVEGYRIYTGPDSDRISTLLKDLPLESLDAGKPAASFDAAAGLGLRLGEQACFTVRAYNPQGESEPTTPRCVKL
ncbi:Ig-like domain-containing protein [Alkalilimnicola sp. S0819]|uniref:Ig-like domain-containing protein n=1 Tax=Alkalilimnicola sp. S0819 TaxID=2613922 RepID=UPI0012619643|nr:Ig-like domain-containing protein [Alkalilimnicola sp. S0819]KAB7627888.1 hypothetical protein F3N43_02625 [Alkalilimnicola sp. S0819]MPQ15524.1 hypothetical protein [Alkalilimnicola sp. S0819]